MTNLVIVAGSTIADVAAQATALIVAGDYVSGLSLSEGWDKDKIGVNVFTLGLVKNNGHFAGFGQSKDKVTITGTTGSLTQIAAALAPSVNSEEVLDLKVLSVGSPTTGSPTYYAVKLARQFDAA